MIRSKPLTVIQEKISRGEYRATVRDVHLKEDSRKDANNIPVLELVFNLQPIVGRTDDLTQPSITVTLGIDAEDAKGVASKIMVLSSRVEQYV